MDDEREPDVREDPRKQGTGEGYPESNPADQTPVEGSEQGPEAGTGPDPQNAPSGGDRDSPPSKATGNPDAAGP
jgi:hypothetical protein